MADTDRGVRYDAAGVAEAAEQFPEWEVNDDKMTREFTFADFAEAWSFMNRVAVVASEMDHHPEWLNVYNLVKISFGTHDLGGLSTRDTEMAKLIESWLP